MKDDGMVVMLVVVLVDGLVDWWDVCLVAESVDG